MSSKSYRYVASESLESLGSGGVDIRVDRVDTAIRGADRGDYVMDRGDRVARRMNRERRHSVALARLGGAQ